MTDKKKSETCMEEAIKHAYAIKDMLNEPKIDWDRVLIYLECIEDEVHDAYTIARYNNIYEGYLNNGEE